MKVYVTKYALTAGIMAISAVDHGDGLMSYIDADGNKRYLHKGEYSANQKDAVEKAQSMRQKKLNSLKAQIKRIEGLKF